MQEQRNKVLINKFQSILRSGKDYTVEAMYEEAGAEVFINGHSARQIINRYYNLLVTQEMIDFVYCNNCKPMKQIDLFSEKFNVCKRESRLLIRYVKKRNQ